MKTVESYKRLPDMEAVALDLGEIFQPSDCRDGLVARKGRIISKDYGEVECVAVGHAPDGGPLRLLVDIKTPNGWQTTLGMISDQGLIAILDELRADNKESK